MRTRLGQSLATGGADPGRGSSRSTKKELMPALLRILRRVRMGKMVPCTGGGGIRGGARRGVLFMFMFMFMFMLLLLLLLLLLLFCFFRCHVFFVDLVAATVLVASS